MRNHTSIIRAPNHLGDVILALPVLVRDGADVMVVRPLAPVLEMAGVPGRVISLYRGAGGFWRAVQDLRRGRYEHGILLSAAFSAAWLFRCGGVKHLRGSRTDGRRLLLGEEVEPNELRGMHRTEAFGVLAGAPTEAAEATARLTPPEDRVALWRDRLGVKADPRPDCSSGVGVTPMAAAPTIGIVPGANAPARRWPAERFGALAETALGWGAAVVVLGGPRERGLTARVTASVPGAVDLGGRTDIADLAAILSLCDLVVTNDTGPMHLAGAVGTPTVSLWGSSDPGEVRQIGSEDTRVTGADLPCRPCYRNHCRRSGRGTLLPHAHEECMSLIQERAVISAVEAALAGGHRR